MLFRSGERRAAQYVTSDDMKLARSAVEDSVNESRRLANEAGQNAQRIVDAGGTLTAKEKAALKASEEAERLAAEADALGVGAERAQASAAFAPF